MYLFLLGTVASNNWVSDQKFTLDKSQRHIIICYCKSNLIMLMYHCKSVGLLLFVCLFNKREAESGSPTGKGKLVAHGHHRPWHQAAEAQVQMPLCNATSIQKMPRDTVPMPWDCCDSSHRPGKQLSEYASKSEATRKEVKERRRPPTELEVQLIRPL